MTRGFWTNDSDPRGLSISHLQYADDTLVFCGTEEDQLKHLRIIFILFEAVSGLHINWSKSFVYPVNEVPEINRLAGILGGKVGEMPTTYLGMPLGANSKSKNIWNAMVETCEKKLNSLWKDVIISRYAMEDSWTTKEVRSPYGVGLWRTIRNLWPKIWRNSKIDIGNGRKTFFWNDVWVGQHSLKQLHLEIYNLNQQKEATVAEVKDNKGWNLSFRRRLNDWEIDKLEDFYKSLEQASNLDAKEDSLQWLRANNRKFTIKSAYRHFDRPAEMLLPWPWKMIWKINVPHKVACFTWLYQRAVAKALVDRVPDEKASTITTVLMVVGAGRGPLVRASLQAAEETGRKLKVYAVEKNPNAIVTLHSLLKIEGWEKLVTIVSSDMRCWDAPEKADILVSELLGSFGDNELSPECLDGAQRFLKEDGISIPSSYTSFFQPVTASKLYNDIKSHKDLVHFETAYVVKFHRVARLTSPQPVFTFNHPEDSTRKSNHRYTKLRFEIPTDTGSALVHGFAGYFDSVLYKDVHLGIEPSTATPNMFSWFPIFFPLRTPMCVQPGIPLEVHIWRCCGTSKVWYEWGVTSPSSSPIHNCNGRSYWVGL
ncbi:hypothetical protein MTR67_033781 [Solanum verrucosum]|uniref:Protein arginine N-methyltransferase n=1 Tax=Solanum verrucosum TaxID=315347 RepID=A0AAF0ZHW3_SOLVR|nr:hypothetical protein MTR67_033781 [Solanum verrucosum]